MSKCVPDRVDNNVGKGDNAGYQHIFSFSHFVFKKTFSQDCLNQELFREGSALFQTTNFRLIQTERVCRRQFQI